MNFTDVFIRRPVLAIVISLAILVLGLRALTSLSVREFPKTENATITIETAYYGASADVIAGFITTPLETAVAQAQGIDYLSSKSATGLSTITATLRLNYDSNRALTEINTKVNSVLNQLPREAQQPSIRVSTGETTSSMYLGFGSEVLAPNQITDYLIRVVKPKFQAIPGVQEAKVLGSGEFALRAWLDPQRLAAMGVTAQDVSNAIDNNNYISAVGATKGQMVTVNLTADTDMHTVEEFKDLIVKRNGNAIVRLQDVANVTLGSDSYDATISYNGGKGVFIAIDVAPDANLLTVIKAVRDEFPAIQAQLPQGMHAAISYDATKFVDAAIHEVNKTLVETLLIVSIVIFLFMGTFRSVLVPVIAMPLSLVGALFIMLALGYSINLLTLLALVLAIGLVVDDAIIVVENIDRHIKQGLAPLQAALLGARELARPIIAISVVLIAVYVPIGFQGGLTGTLFSEFAFTLAGAVGVSAVIALTLSPMLSAWVFSRPHGQDRLAHWLDSRFDALRDHYHRALRVTLESWGVVVGFGVIVIGLIFVLFKFSQTELAPDEDQGVVPYMLTGAPSSTLDQTSIYMAEIFKIASAVPEYDNMFQVGGFAGTNTSFGGVLFTPWSDRKRTQQQIMQELQQKYNGIAGARIAAFPFPSLPGGGEGLPLEFVIGTTDSFLNLNEIAATIMQKAQATGQFYFLDNDLKLDKPQTTVVVDRDKVATLGLTNKDVGSALTAMLGGGYVNYFSIAGRAYKVIPQVQRSDRQNADQLNEYYIRTPSGAVVPASTVISLKNETVPQSINHFQQLNSATISGVAGVPLGQAIETLNTIAKEVLPQGYSVDYSGQSRQVVKESSGFVFTLLFAIIIIYLTLAAQFESFLDPLVVMMSVPMAIFGAMVFIFEGAATLNIYTQVGLVTLIGLIAKHGILIVEFANDEQRAGKSKREAVENAAATRLRPILMTSAAMVLGVVPLMIASGAGAVGRNHMGIVIGTGISIGTLFTLFVVPAMYMLLSKDHSKDRVSEVEPAVVEQPEPVA